MSSPLPCAPVTRNTPSFSAKAAGARSAAQPHTAMRACGDTARMRATAWRDFFSASAVTAQVLRMKRSASSSVSDTSHPLSRRACAREALSQSLTLQPKVKMTAFIPILPKDR